MEQTLKLNGARLQSLHLFGDICEQAINSVDSRLIKLTPVREVKDGIGRHWYGMRCKMQCKLTGQHFFLHIGLVFLPATKTGLMVEVDRRNNLQYYGRLRETIADAALFEANSDEQDYLKLFMPDAQYAQLNHVGRCQQVIYIADYIKACGEAIAEIMGGTGFELNYCTLGDIYSLGIAMENLLKGLQSKAYTIEIDSSNGDNYSEYQSGYHLQLTSGRSAMQLYLYLGIRFQYRGDRNGAVVVVDKQQNPAFFHRLAMGLQINITDYEVSYYDDSLVIWLYKGSADGEAMIAAMSVGAPKVLEELAL